MIQKINLGFPRQYYVRNLTLTDSVWKYKEEIQELGNKLGIGEVYGVMCHTEYQELDSLLLIIENEDNITDFIQKVYEVLLEDFSFINAIPMKEAIETGFAEHLSQINRLV